MVTDKMHRDPGNPIVGLLLLLPVLAVGDYILNDGQFTAVLTAWYQWASTLSMPTGSGGGIPASIQLIALLAVLGFIAYTMRGRLAEASKPTTKGTAASEEKQNGVGNRQSRRLRVSSDIRIGETK